MQFELLKRREFITLLGGAMGWPLSARAQQPPRQHPLVGYLITGTKDGLAPDVSAFLNRLRDLGYIEGQNIEIAKRYADTDSARLPALAAELVQLQPNLILAFDPPAAVAARKTTASIPIVAAILNDPLRLELIASYARPRWQRNGHFEPGRRLTGQTD
jgi:putative tryptophan/tyrosine transport system substrate-binding protein